MLAMVANDNAGSLNARVIVNVHREHARSYRSARPEYAHHVEPDPSFCSPVRTLADPWQAPEKPHHVQRSRHLHAH
ncbi:hypothetical protein DM828_13520 [Pseudomonas umsongensis]|nr:hypothetical protein [Pseudomonas umsongensis]